MSEKTYYQRNRDVILNRAKKYYEQVKSKYWNLSEEEKNKKRKYERNKYHNISEGKKQKLKLFFFL